MIPFFIGPLTCLSASFRSRYNLGLEILALRQQLGILKRKDKSLPLWGEHRYTHHMQLVRARSRG